MEHRQIKLEHIFMEQMNFCGTNRFGQGRRHAGNLGGMGGYGVPPGVLGVTARTRPALAGGCLGGICGTKGLMDSTERGQTSKD